MENEVFNTKSKFWKDVQSNLIFIGIVELLIYNIGLLIKYAVQAKVDPFTPLFGKEYGVQMNANFWIIIPIIMSLIFFYLTCKGVLDVLKEGTIGRKMKSIGKGFVLGVLCIGILSLLGMVFGAITFSINGFDWRIIPVIIPLFIQCSAEEILLRGYVPAVLKDKHSWDVVCFVSGTLFIFHHILNMLYFGFNWMFCLNVFLLGVMFCLLMKKEGNFWITCGIHTGWNYAQMYIFGVSNSGNPSTVGIFQGLTEGSPTFYDGVFGFEAAATATVLVGICIMFLIYKLFIKKQVS